MGQARTTSPRFREPPMDRQGCGQRAHPPFPNIEPAQLASPRASNAVGMDEVASPELEPVLAQPSPMKSPRSPPPSQSAALFRGGPLLTPTADDALHRTDSHGQPEGEARVRSTGGGSTSISWRRTPSRGREAVGGAGSGDLEATPPPPTPPWRRTERLIRFASSPHRGPCSRIRTRFPSGSKRKRGLHQADLLCNAAGRGVSQQGGRHPLGPYRVESRTRLLINRC